MVARLLWPVLPKLRTHAINITNALNKPSVTSVSETYLKQIIYINSIYPKIKEGDFIKDVAIKVADERDTEFAEALQNLGANRNVARIITHLKNAASATAREIEMATNLKQPEVSIAMRTMRANGWVTERDVRGDGKGRPYKIYVLRSSIDEIIRYYEEEKKQEAARTMGAIQRLKELSSA
jgi:predicted transcriptional regulator